MPVGLLDAYVQQMDAHKADRLLDAAAAAVYPHMGERPAKTWWARQAKRMAPMSGRRRRSKRPQANKRWTPFTLTLVDDGSLLADAEPMAFGELKGHLAGVNRTLGRRFSVLDA